MLPGKQPPGKAPKDYPDDYEALPILGVVGAHVDDLMCGGEGPEWESAIKTLVSGLKFGDRKYPPFTYCGTDYTQISVR